MIENIDTKEQVAHISYKDMETLDFQIMLPNNYYANPNSIPSLVSNENKRKHKQCE